MKRFFYATCLSFFALISCADLLVVSAHAQFKNPGFEQKAASDTGLPDGWGIRPVEGFTATLVSDVKYKGSSSLRMDGQPQDPTKFMNVAQTIDLTHTELKRIKVTFHVKTENLQGNVAMWCQIWNGEQKQIGFENSGMQGVHITGTTDWKKYTLTLTLPREAKHLYLGAYTMGKGTAWFDEFAFEEVEGANEPPTEEVLKFHKEFTDLVKTHSIYKDSINWNSLEQDARALSKGLKTTADAVVLNNLVLQHLRKAGDNHSFIQNKVQAQNYAAGNTSPAKPEAKLLANGIGYISVPGYGSINKEAGEAFAGTIQGLIGDLDKNNDIKGWVVDLRTNTGGNMYPMISGLGPLLDVGHLGYFMKGETGNPWVNTANGMGVEVKAPYKIKNRENKIAVLIGPRTSSSGEMTAITFIGQHNTKLFGAPSGGYITANQRFPLSDGSNLLLASSYVADRNKKKYLQRIFPDVAVQSVANQDTVLDTAVSWLSNP